MGSEKIRKYRFVGSEKQAEEYGTGTLPVYGKMYDGYCTWFCSHGRTRVDEFFGRYPKEWELVEEGSFSISGTVANSESVEGLNKLAEAIDNGLYSDPFYCYLLGMDSISDDVHGTLAIIMNTYKKYYEYGHI